MQIRSWNSWRRYRSSCCAWGQRISADQGAGPKAAGGLLNPENGMACPVCTVVKVVCAQKSPVVTGTTGLLFLRGERPSASGTAACWVCQPTPRHPAALFHLGDAGPHFRQLGVQLEEYSWSSGSSSSENRVHRHSRFTQGAVDTFIGMDHQEIRPFVETVHRANFHSPCVLQLIQSSLTTNVIRTTPLEMFPSFQGRPSRVARRGRPVRATVYLHKVGI